MRITERLLTRAGGADASTIDAVAAVALGVCMLATTAGSKHHAALTLFAAAVLSATVAWRRQSPRITTPLGVIAIVTYIRSGGNSNVPLEPFAILLNYYMLGRLSAEHERMRLELLLVAVAIPAVAISPGNQAVIDVTSGWALFVAIPFAAGRAIGSRSALTQELRANAERLEREQQERAARATAEERNRIARELHDVVAHSVSVMVIQTAAARRVAAGDREAAREALRSVETCGREALAEMRRMIGVLRRGDVELAGAAAPGLSQLSALAERARAAGLPVELRFEGEPRELSPGLDLVAFRIVQEALTNAIKHAGPARARVRVIFTAAAVELEVSDSGRGSAAETASFDGGGHGLVGMRERLALYGGELHTGRRRGGGFEVRARLPLEQLVVA